MTKRTIEFPFDWLNFRQVSTWVEAPDLHFLWPIAGDNFSLQILCPFVMWINLPNSSNFVMPMVFLKSLKTILLKGKCQSDRTPILQCLWEGRSLTSLRALHSWPNHTGQPHTCPLVLFPYLSPAFKNSPELCFNRVKFICLPYGNGLDLYCNNLNNIFLAIPNKCPVQFLFATF